MGTDKFEVIIIGAGIAGLSAAYKLAQSGVEVLVVERGEYPGSKNLSGGILYSRVLDQLIPSFWEEAPIERYITNYLTTLMTEEDYFNLEYKGKSLRKTPYNAVSVLRGKFDRWLAEKAEEAGAMVITGFKVEKVIKEGERIVGIKAGEEEMLADVVIAADGINSFIGVEAGLRKEINTKDSAIGIKALVELPQSVLEERFRLIDREGTGYAILGQVTEGVAGGGFLYTNLESLSIGIVLFLDELIASGKKPEEILDGFLKHPMLVPLTEGGKMTEYGAHLTAEGGYHGVPERLFTDGLVLVGDAAGLTINNGLVIRGMDLAIESGIAAAEAIIKAKKAGDFSANALSAYQEKLEKTTGFQDLKLYAKAPKFMENKRLYTQYPLLVNQMFKQIYTHDLRPKEHLLKTGMKSLKEAEISVFDLFKDGFKGARAL